MELDTKNGTTKVETQGQGMEKPTKQDTERETTQSLQTSNASDVNPDADRLLKIHALLEDLTSSPWSHDVLELAIATAISLLISERDRSAWVWLLIVGPPSGDKTAVVLHLRSSPRVLYIDTLTENALSSGYVPEGGKKRGPDLLDRIEKGGVRCVLFKDFTTLFSLKADRVTKVIGELQSVFDGEFNKATGTVGLREHRANFAILACITPLALIKHHKYMAEIGTRFLSYCVPRLTDDERAQGFEVSWEAADRRKKMDDLRQLVKEHIKALLESPVELEPETTEQRARLNRLAELLAHSRAAIQWRKAMWDAWEIENLQIEEPYRALQQLRNLGRALTLVHGRRRLSDHELELLRQVVLGSTPADRAEVLRLFQDQPDGVTVNSCAEGIGKSTDRARQLLQELERVELVVRQPGQPDGQGRPADRYVPVTKFAGLITTPREAMDHVLDLGSYFTDKTPPKDKQPTKEG